MSEVPLRYLVGLNLQILPEATAANFAFRYVDISQVDTDGNVLVPASLTRFAEAPSRARRLAERGDTIVSTVRTYLRAIAQAPACVDPLVFSTGFAVLHPISVESRFLAYSCRAEPFVHQVVSRSTGVSYPAINPSELLNIKIRLPRSQEQRRIVDFLDNHVARIDHIIGDRREQMLLVAQAYSSYLDALVDRFETIPLRRVLKKIEQGWSPVADSVPAGFEESGVLRLGAIRAGTFHPDQNKAFLPESEPRSEYRVHEGDLLVTRANTPSLVGDAAVARDVGLVPLYLSDLIYRVKLSDYDPNLASTALRTSQARQLIGVIARGTSGSMPKLRGEDLAELPLPAVPRKQQSSLGALEVAERAARDRRIRSIDRSINLLSEYKSSLITAAVTGNLDVTTAGSGILS